MYYGESSNLVPYFILFFCECQSITLEVIVESGIPKPFSLISIDCNNSWILDINTTNHLTRSSEHFVSYILCVGNEKIKIAFLDICYRLLSIVSN